MRIVLNLSRILTGALFIFSGLIKANDPMGFAFKLEEYFTVFGTEWLSPLSVSLSIVICALEIVLGVAVLLGTWIRPAAWGLLMMILFFTWLTFYSAWFNKVTDCGCFGDAIPLTPWQSFGKDLILLLLILVIFLNRRKIRPLLPGKAGKIITGLAFLVSLGFGICTYNYLPVIDFRPYKTGNNIPALMQMPENAEPDVYKVIYTLKNKATGETRKMDDAEYLEEKVWEDENWEIEDTSDPILVKKGYTPPIHNLQIADANGVDFTSEILENPFYNLVIVMYELDKTHIPAQDRMNKLAEKAQEYNIRTVGLTASSNEATQDFISQTGGLYEIFYADAVPLKTMIRSNPGLMLLRNGTVIKKWHYNNLPTPEELENTYFANQE